MTTTEQNIFEILHFYCMNLANLIKQEDDSQMQVDLIENNRRSKELSEAVEMLNHLEMVESESGRSSLVYSWQQTPERAAILQSAQELHRVANQN